MQVGNTDTSMKAHIERKRERPRSRGPVFAIQAVLEMPRRGACIGVQLPGDGSQDGGEVLTNCYMPEPTEMHRHFSAWSCSKHT